MSNYLGSIHFKNSNPLFPLWKISAIIQIKALSMIRKFFGFSIYWPEFDDFSLLSDDYL